MLPPHLYARQGSDRGYSPSGIRLALQEDARLRDLGTYPVYSLGHLAHQTGASYSYLREVASRTRDPYKTIPMAKSRGGTRKISAPEPILMDVQRWLLKNVLPALSVHSAAYAYRPGVSIVQCAEQHIGARWMVKMDLHDFFGTVSEREVYYLYRKLGYAKLVAFELARICTRADGADHSMPLNDNLKIGAYSVDRLGVLPQGGPTSGYLANAVAGRLDRLINQFSIQNDLVYTRYSDDIAISGAGRFERTTGVGVIREISRVMHISGFIPHHSKTRIIPPGARKIILGLQVDNSVRLLPESRRKIEVHLRGCEKFGLGDHAAHRGFRSVFSFVDHLEGWIAFAFGVEPDRASQWRIRLRAVMEREGLSELAQI